VRRLLLIGDQSGGSAGTVRKFVWCGSSLCQARDVNYAVERSYLEEGERIVAGNGKALYYGVDQLGSVRRVFKSATEATEVEYDPYGSALQSLPFDADVGFAGMFSNDPAANYLTWFRPYDPALGRWLNRDPLDASLSLGKIVLLSDLRYSQDAMRSNDLGRTWLPTGNIGSANLYNYVSSNPVAFYDPTGLQQAPRYLPGNLSEQLAMQEAMGGAGMCIISPTQFPAGGQKFAHNHGGIEIHYMKNANGISGDFKFK